MVIDTADPQVATSADELAEALLMPVWNTLSERADQLRRALPPRPESVDGRYRWWRLLDAEQQRQAALLDRLDALCGHLAGRPALGYAPHELLPDDALHEAVGFNPQLSALIARCLAQRAGRAS
ncbi:hypothetical protein [Streptomyces sp. MBT27]|uniref:hypothetical protein n=1 Tax=Streptomyces sp. MBT27 TaxID=1488356 RepID=UPI00142275E1|nr:hypothetical protein [Streptomyces sp. MBT27]